MATNDVCLSVVIPAADGRVGNLNLVLTSLEQQTLPRERFEVIIVSDGGQDSFGDVLKMHKALNPVFVWQPKHDPMGGELGRRLKAVLPDKAMVMDSPEALAWQEAQREFFVNLIDEMRPDWFGTMQPRNRGALNARFPFLVFADSDVVLHPRALEYYAEDFTENPRRVICGLYHWLKPMRVTPRDVRQAFDDILEERLPEVHLEKAHSVMRDPRSKSFAEYDRTHVFQPKDARERMQQYPAYLSCFSGNIGWNAELFAAVGGYWNALAAGAHEDGASGIAACFAGAPLSYDARIVGGHINHVYNRAYRNALWLYEIPMLNARYRLDRFQDGTGEMHDHLPALQTMTEVWLKWLGVWDWDPARVKGSTN